MLLQEKSSSIPDDLGRDFNATSSYLKRHEAFENELVALEAQVMTGFFFPPADFGLKIRLF